MADRKWKKISISKCLNVYELWNYARILAEIRTQHGSIVNIANSIVIVKLFTCSAAASNAECRHGVRCVPLFASRLQLLCCGCVVRIRKPHSPWEYSTPRRCRQHLNVAIRTQQRNHYTKNIANIFFLFSIPEIPICKLTNMQQQQQLPTRVCVCAC